MVLIKYKKDVTSTEPPIKRAFHPGRTYWVFLILSVVKPASSIRVTFVKLDSILLMKWPSLLQMPWLVIVWTVVTSV